MRNRKYAYFILIIVSLLFITCGHKSGRKDNQNLSNHNIISQPFDKYDDFKGKTVIKMEKINGVYQIPVLVNGVKMHFIFDTGASTISISVTEASFLYKQGELKDEDIKGTANYSDANGDISEGTIINLTTVQIGNRVLKNIEASVVHNLNAPLLFGQSALEKFGKITIDNSKSEITFE
jgi:aspartyl protease family protein